MIPGPPPPVAPYNPQYSDPSTASMESLQRTMAAAQAARQNDFHGAFLVQNDHYPSFGGPLLHSSSNDRAQFPAPGTSIVQLTNDSFEYAASNQSSLYSMSNPSMSELQPSPASLGTPTPFNNYSGSSQPDNTPQIITPFPSQLLSQQNHDGLRSSSLCKSPESSSPEESKASVDIGFKYEHAESEASEASPPAPTIPFKAPAPMDIASRRKKDRPAALFADTLKARPVMGPRTVSHAEGFCGPSDSPIGSPKRRIQSAGGNRSFIMSGRINKSGVESAQRSPINLGGFAEAGAFLEHNYHNIRQPSLSGASSLNSSLAPPTPMSPRGMEMTLTKREASSTASPPQGMNFVFGNGCFTSMEGDQNLASPPETPQAQLPMHPMSNGWPTSIDFGDKQWHYEVPDEPLYTPANDNFQLELQMPQPSYLSSLGQPVTPAFGQYNPNGVFGNDSPQYTLLNQEYSFPESTQYNGGMRSVSPMTKQKTFHFSNSTPADFTEK